MQLMSISKAAVYLGVSESTIYRYADNGELPTFIENGLMKFDKKSLDLLKKYPVKEAKKRLKKILED